MILNLRREKTMCLCIPSVVLSTDLSQMSARVDTLGVTRDVNISLIESSVNIGDHLLIHVGFAISKIDQQEAMESLATYRTLLDEMDKEDVHFLLS